MLTFLLLFGAIVGVFVVRLRGWPLLHRVLLRGVRHAHLVLGGVLAGVLTSLGGPIAAIRMLFILAASSASAR